MHYTNCVSLNVKIKGIKLSNLFKRLKFSLKVLSLSLQIPLQIIVIVLFSSITLYVAPVAFMSFVLWNIEYIHIQNWEMGARFTYAIFVIVLSLAIFGRRNKLF